MVYLIRSVFLFLMTSYFVVGCSSTAQRDEQVSGIRATAKPQPSYSLPPKTDDEPNEQSQEDEDTQSESLRTLIGFGGMYSESDFGTAYRNPATNDFTCPSGYTRFQVLGSPDEDSRLYSCQRFLGDDEAPLYDFGGAYGFWADGEYENPTTGAATCPSGYQSHQVFGSSERDHALYFCACPSEANEPADYGFGGFIGQARDGDFSSTLDYSNNCNTDYYEYEALGSSQVDWPLSYCIRSLQTGQSLFPVEDGPASIDFYPLYDRGFAGFGGMYSLRNSIDNSYRNPVTQDFSCPLGYISEQVWGAGGLDAALFLCYKTEFDFLEVAVFDFGGMFGRRPGGNYNNPFTNDDDCPEGFVATKVLGTYGYDYGLFYCHREQLLAESTPYSFGGVFGDSPYADLHMNPLTGEKTCPDQHTMTQVLGANAVDWPVYMCGAETEPN